MLMDNELYHYGVKGMKWGVRRYQNYDGTRTAEGKKHSMYRNRTIRAGKTKGDVEDIINSMNKEDKDKVLAGSKEYLSYEQGSAVVKRVLKKIGDKPVSFFDILDDGDSLNLAMGTRSGKEYRGRGYGSEVAKKGVKWIEDHKDELDQTQVVWGVKTSNKASIRIAEKNGFKLDKDSYSDDHEWVNYVKKLK